MAVTDSLQSLVGVAMKFWLLAVPLWLMAGVTVMFWLVEVVSDSFWLLAGVAIIPMPSSGFTVQFLKSALGQAKGCIRQQIK